MTVADALSSSEEVALQVAADLEGSGRIATTDGDLPTETTELTVPADDSVPANELAVVGDRVWHDLDHNGVQDDGEPGVEGVVVRLLDPEFLVVDTATTDRAGTYRLEGQTGGAYWVEFELTDEWTPTLALHGEGLDRELLDSDAGPEHLITTVSGGSVLRVAVVLTGAADQHESLDAGLVAVVAPDLDEPPASSESFTETTDPADPSDLQDGTAPPSGSVPAATDLAGDGDGSPPSDEVPTSEFTGESSVDMVSSTSV